MSALERLKDCARNGSCGHAVADLRELIATVEKRDAEVEDLVEKFQNALHTETERANALAVRVAELEAEAREPVRLGRNVEMRGALVVVRGAPTCPHCRDDDNKRLGCRACEETGLLHLEDIRPDYDELLEAIDARDEGIKTLRAELAELEAELKAWKSTAAQKLEDIRALRNL